MSELQNQFFEVLINIARLAEGHAPLESTDKMMIEGLVTNIGGDDIDAETIISMTQKAYWEKAKVSPTCETCASRGQCGRNTGYEIARLNDDNADVHSLKSLILFGTRIIADYAYRALQLGKLDRELTKCLYRYLFIISEQWDMDELTPLLKEIAGNIEKAKELAILAEKEADEITKQKVSAPKSMTDLIHTETMPVCFSENVMNYIQKNYHIESTKPEKILACIF